MYDTIENNLSVYVTMPETHYYPPYLKILRAFNKTCDNVVYFQQNQVTLEIL